MQTEQQTRQLSLHDYLTILDRRKWVIIEATVIAAAVAFFVSLSQDKVFTAASEVLLARQTIATSVAGFTSPDSLGDPDRFAQTQAGLARSPEVVARAIALARVPDLSVVELLRRSDVTPRTNADLLRFTVQNGDDVVATRLANAYAQAFTRYKFDLDTGQVREARQELVKRLEELRESGDTQSAQYRELLDSERGLRTLELLQVQSPIVERATRAPQTAPRTIRSLILGALLGAILGLGLAFLWEALDKRVRTEEEIERRLDLPLLSRIPAPGKRLRDEGRLAMLSSGQDASAEAIRRLRTNLEFALLDRDVRVLMITSAVQQEGKSTTVSNLAVALARSGRDVALLDLDLRRPLVADLFGVQRLPGVTDVVLRRSELDDALVSVPLPEQAARSIREDGTGSVGRLRVLPAGDLPANPGEFVGTTALGAILDRLRADCDFVLLDAPPLLLVGDAMTLSAKADAIVVVSRLGVVNRRMLDDVSRELAASPAAKLGIVVTGVKELDSYGYAYGHDAPTKRDAPPAAKPSRSERRRRERVATGSDR